MKTLLTKDITMLQIIIIFVAGILIGAVLINSIPVNPSVIEITQDDFGIKLKKEMLYHLIKRISYVQEYEFKNHEDSYSKEEENIIKKYCIDDWLKKFAYVYSEYRARFYTIKNEDYMLIPLPDANTDWANQAFSYAATFVKDNNSCYIYFSDDIGNFFCHEYIYIRLNTKGGEIVKIIAEVKKRDRNFFYNASK
ncbi:MAG: hypothetical protein KKB31_06025 [Nanoarchaeota archaeon]|nr:hypothetical protein [Nanoarchaeota archaeon]